MSKHTPGPWFAQDTRLVGGQAAVVGPNHDRKAGEQGVMVVAHVNGRSGEQGANAWLIAAAPALLAACELTLAHLTSAAHRETKIIPPVLAALRASIAKATGGDM